MGWPNDIESVASQIELFAWTRETARERQDLTDGVKAFSADDSKNADAAAATERYLKESALDDHARHTRILAFEGLILGFYSLSVAEAHVTSSSSRKKMGARSQETRIPTAHIDWIARDRRAPRQTGRVLIEHAVAVVRHDVHLVIPVLALTLDPYDTATSAMWREHFGFRNTATVAHDGLARLYVPLQGYGSFKASLPGGDEEN